MDFNTFLKSLPSGNAGEALSEAQGLALKSAPVGGRRNAPEQRHFLAARFLFPGTATGGRCKQERERRFSGCSRSQAQPSAATETVSSSDSADIPKRLRSQAGKSSGDGNFAPEPLGTPIDGTLPHVLVPYVSGIQEEALPQLEGTTITHYATEATADLPQLIAVNDTFITYGLLKGHVRVLHRQTGTRALLKDHDALLTDLRFVGDTDDLASASSSGAVVIWRLWFDGQQVAQQTLASLRSADSTGGSTTVRLACHPLLPGSLAVASGGTVALLSLADLAGPDAAQQTLPQPIDARPGIRVAAAEQAAVGALAFSPDGGRLVLGTRAGTIKAIRVGGAGPAGDEEAAAEAAVGSAVSSITWLATDTVLVGGGGNTELQIWHIRDGLGFQHRQTAVLKGGSARPFAFAFDAPHGLVLLSDVGGTGLVVLHLAPGRGGFDAATQFRVTMPVLSMDVRASGASEAGAAELQVFTVQTQAIQQYVLQPELCLPAERPAESGLEAATAPPEPPRIPSSAFAVGAPSGQAQTDATGIEAPATVSAVASAPPLPESPAPDPEIAVPPLPAPPPALAAQPPLLTPSQLMQATKAALPRSVSGNSSIVDSEAGAAKQPPAAGSLLSRLFPAASAATSSAGAPPPPRPSSVVENAQPRTATPPTGLSIGASPPDFIPLAAAADAATPSQPEAGPQQPPDPSQPPASDAPAAAAPSAEKEAEVFRGDVPPPARLVSRAPADPGSTTLEAVRQALQGIGEGDAPKASPKAEAPGISTLSDLYDRIQRDQQRHAQQQSQAHQATVRTLRDELKRESKRIEAAAEAQVARLAKAQLRTIADERKALIAEERQNLEKLLVAISGSLNRDLPQRIEDILRREVAAVAQQVGASVSAAVSDALPRDVAGGSIQAPLERALASQLRAALTKPVQDGLRQSFQQQVIPAFEGACQSMFAQVQATFAGGLAEHLQAAGGANSAVAASLQESIGSANVLAAKLADDISSGYQQLLELASREGQERAGVGNGMALALRPDHRAELSRLLEASRYQDAFSKALDLGDVSLVAWLCSQVDPRVVLGSTPPELSQQIMLVLLQQLSYDLSQDSALKVRWIKDLAVELDPSDPLLAPHARGVLEGAVANVRAHAFTPRDAKAARFAAAVLESALAGCDAHAA